MIYNDNKGITLVELIVVIGVLALLLSIVMPKINKNPFTLLAASRTMRDDIKKIRYSKMAEGKNYRIVFKKNSYLILEGPRIKKRIEMDKGYSISQNFKDSQIAFSYIGAPTTSGGTVLIFDVDNNKYCEITVVPATGRVLFKNKILDGYSRSK